MREIKFRAWDKKNNVFATFVNDVVRVACDGSLPTIRKEKDSIVLQQYTGLKDKNGKEIYEGDIVSWKRIPHLINEEWEEWEKAGKPLQIHNFEVKWRYGMFLPFNGWGQYYSEDGEVIGNIFENPELI